MGSVKILRLDALLHQDGAEPAAELETDLSEVALVLKSEAFVQGNR